MLRRPVLRKLIIAASVFALAAPAAAQDYPDPRDDEIVRDLPPPGEVEEVGNAIGRAADAIMDVEIGPVVDAIDPGRRFERRGRDRTIGDLASRRDPYARERMRDSIYAATAGIGAVIEQIAVLTPVLRRTIEDAERRMDAAMRDRRVRPRDYDRDHDRDYDRDYDPGPDPHDR
jgi:hypothetical protein